MKTEELNRVGNVGKVKSMRVIVESAGLISTPELVLKSYRLIEGPRDNQTLTKGWFAKGINGLEKFVKDELKSKRLETYSRMGFAIKSEDTFNIAVWGRNIPEDHPYLPHNYVYLLDEKGNITLLKEMREGAYCAFELMIAGFEANQWLEFLRSEKTPQDKFKYLRARIPRAVIEV